MKNFLKALVYSYIVILFVLVLSGWMACTVFCFCGDIYNLNRSEMMSKGIIECKGPYVEGAVLLPEGMTIININLHYKWDSDDYLLMVEHPDIPERGQFNMFLPWVMISYGQDEQGNKTVTDW